MGRSYAALTEDTTRIMGRLKALYRSQAIACAGKKPYGAGHREEWLAQLSDRGCNAGRDDSTRSSMCCSSCAAKPGRT